MPPLFSPRRIRATGYPFGQPLPLATLKAWYAADAEAYANNASVTALTDKSGLGNNATQATAGQRAVFKTNILNGLSMYLFDGVDDNYDIPVGAEILAAGSIFAVAYHSAMLTASETERIVEFTSPATHPSAWLGLVNLASTVDCVWWDAYSGGYQWSQWVPIDQTTSTNRIFVVGATFSQAKNRAALFVNGGVSMQSPTGNVTIATGGTRKVGGYNATNDTFNGYIGEVMTWNTELTLAECDAVSQYLLKKWMPTWNIFPH